ncbi:hypothetical protein K492DRAFT_198674 [Lichtheimia hyalospora FSU 10163]|nr:hypothetical protein K492DRAFT_198674 [Lichtheimia hyalospora FSU 10163]
MSETNDNKSTEVDRLNKFVDAAPQYSYNIDQYRGQICRQLPGGQEECLKLSLEYTEMFSQMQKLGFFCALPMDPKKTHMECTRV